MLQENLAEQSYMYQNIVWTLKASNEMLRQNSTSDMIAAYEEVIGAINAVLAKSIEYSYDEKRLRYQTLNVVCKLCVARQSTCTKVQYHIFHGIRQDVDNTLFPDRVYGLYNTAYDVKGE